MRLTYAQKWISSRIIGVQPNCLMFFRRKGANHSLECARIYDKTYLTYRTSNRPPDNLMLHHPGAQVAVEARTANIFNRYLQMFLTIGLHIPSPVGLSRFYTFSANRKSNHDR